jgi:hypothetical protein
MHVAPGMKFTIQPGQTRFGRGVVIGEISVPSPCQGKPRRTARGARLLCDCGNEYTARLDHLREGRTVSCGCRKSEVGKQTAGAARMARLAAPRRPGRQTTRKNKMHGLHDHLLYPTWYMMLARCEKPAHQAYKNYGGLGDTTTRTAHGFPRSFVMPATIARRIGSGHEGAGCGPRWPASGPGPSRLVRLRYVSGLAIVWRRAWVV